MIPERTLAGLALGLIADKRALTPPERKLSLAAIAASESEVEAVRSAILLGDDPLGEQFCVIRSAEQRRGAGATYTPNSIVSAMVDWAAREPKAPAQIVDAGAGSGRYLMKSAHVFPNAQLVAVEIDPLAVLLLRANASVHGFSGRLTVLLEDYREIALPEIEGPTLFIGNPPYVRHHDIGEAWKDWFARSARAQGFSASRLAGLHVHFYLKTRELARTGDFGTFITAAEWLDVNYGSILRKMLADGLGGASLHVIDPKAQPFADALATGAIVCFRVGNRPSQFAVCSVDSLDALAPLSGGRQVEWSALDAAPRWSHFVRGEARDEEGMIELGELFRVHRGQVTGCNAAWIENEAMRGLPERFLFASVTRARELIKAEGGILSKGARLKRVLDLPEDLDGLDNTEKSTIEKFLKVAKGWNAHSGYVATHRRAWWSVGLKDPAPVLCTYMARRAPAFVLNRAGARHLNISHGLYPRGKITDSQIEAVVAYLRREISTDSGRTYAGGLVKFEPKELERVKIPALYKLHGEIPDSVVPGRATGRRRSGQRHIQG